MFFHSMLSPAQKRVAILVALTSICVGLFVLNVQKSQELEKVITVPSELSGLSNFELGDYYFNSDDDPAGPYDIKKARYFYEKEIAGNPTGNNLVWYQLGRIEFLEGNFDEALRKFSKQQEYFSDEIPNVYYSIGLTYGYKARITNDPADWKGGEDAFKKFIEIVPAAPWSRVDLAWIYFSQGKYEEMKPVLEMGLAYHPNNPWLLNMYGLAVLNTEGKDASKTHFHKAKDFAALLTTEEWGKAYPGNNPEVWGEGLQEFQNLIAKNVALAESE